MVEGLLPGLHRSPQQGQSVEFADYKEYAPGDELRHIDWRAWGRMDRWYVKRFENETNLRAILVIDTSASMGTHGEHLTKLEYAAALAAALAYLLLSQHDQVGLVARSRSARVYLPPGARGDRYRLVCRHLEALRPAGATAVVEALQEVAERARGRSLVVLLSDLIDAGAVVQAARQVRGRRHDVIVLQVLDPHELQFPLSEPTELYSPEDGRRVRVDPGAVRGDYLAALGRWLAELRAGLRDADVEYRLVDSSRPPAEVLLALVQDRARRKAAR